MCLVGILCVPFFGVVSFREEYMKKKVSKVVVLIFRKQQVEVITSHKNNGCGGVATTNICFEKAY
jgi:hypothetical protein